MECSAACCPIYTKLINRIIVSKILLKSLRIVQLTGCELDTVSSILRKVCSFLFATASRPRLWNPRVQSK